MKPFNLERALAGDKVVTRSGIEVVELYYINTMSKVVAVVNGSLEMYLEDGSYIKGQETRFDLFMSPKKIVIERWANVYRNGSEIIYNTKEDADNGASGNRIACVKLTGEYESEE